MILRRCNPISKGQLILRMNMQTILRYGSIAGCIAVDWPTAGAFPIGADVAPQINRVGDLTVFVERAASPNGKPPVLLIHGMFGGAWYWENTRHS
jgi:pimeloyl-ACP methyl ester carboxylesterase